MSHDPLTPGLSLSQGACREPSPFLRAVNLSKTYQPAPLWLRPLVRTASREPVPALCGVSLEMGAGEVVGLVGPNGAGKSTLIRIITTLLSPSSGSVSVCGFDTMGSSEEVRRRVGLVLDSDRGIYDRLDGFRNLEFFGMMSGLTPERSRERAGELLRLMGLDRSAKLVFGYSSGMRSRLSLARALIADPPLLVLDEPTRSLDPLASRAFLNHLEQLAAAGRAVLLSSHRLDEVATVCTRIVALIDGRVGYDGDPMSLASSGGSAGAGLAALLSQGSGGS